VAGGGGLGWGGNDTTTKVGWREKARQKKTEEKLRSIAESDASTQQARETQAVLQQRFESLNRVSEK
jgi:hypothetical protein